MPTPPPDEHQHAPAVTAVAAATPPPVSRSARRHAAKLDAAAARTRVRTVGGTGGSSPAMRMLLWGLVGMLGMVVAGVMSGAIDVGARPGSGPTDLPGGRDRDGSWSYYHDRDYQTDATGAKWDTDRSRSSDPDEAVLGDTSRWEYDGPYRYGPYGSDGMRRRQSGRETRDPLYSQPAPIQDVFSTYGGDLDPSGGQPVGVAPSSMTNPYYDPYAGYSNPYANRIRLAYGEGVGRGAAYDPEGW